MKKSTKLIALLCAFTFIILIGTGFSLKGEFEKIDRTDPYFGYKREKLAPFSHIKLSGVSCGLVRVNSGKAYEMRVADMSGDDDSRSVAHIVKNDTLFISFKNKEGQRIPFDGNSFRFSPCLYIFAPQLSGLVSHQIPVAMDGIKSDRFVLHQTGQGAMISNNSFKNLDILGDSSAFLRVGEDNKIESAQVSLQDSSTFESKKDVYQTFALKFDDQSQINIPGSLLRKQK